MDEAIYKTNERFYAAAQQDAPDSAAWTLERADMHLFVTLLRTFKVRSIITMFSINSLTGFNFITHDVWLSYRQPTVSRYTENDNIPGSIEVSMYLKTTLTLERMSFPVSFVSEIR